MIQVRRPIYKAYAVVCHCMQTIESLHDHICLTNGTTSKTFLITHQRHNEYYLLAWCLSAGIIAKGVQLLSAHNAAASQEALHSPEGRDTYGQSINFDVSYNEHELYAI